MKSKRSYLLMMLAALICGMLVASLLPDLRVVRGEAPSGSPAQAPRYHSPSALLLSPDGKTLYVADQTAQALAIFDLAANSKRAEIPLQGNPRRLALNSDGSMLWVAEHGAGTVALIDPATASVVSRVTVGRWPTAMAVASKTKRLFVCNQDQHNVAVFDLAQSPPTPLAVIPVLREPSAVAITADERFAVVTNFLPHGVGTDPQLAAEVNILDVAKLSQRQTVKLPSGSSVVRDVCLSPDGKWAYVVHGLGRFNLPITQLERGWVNTFALSILDIEKGTRLATLLLDDLTQGAADPSAIVCSPDGARLWIAHAGTHELSLVNVGRIHELLSGKIPPELASLQDGSLPNIWVRIQHDRKQIDELENDLTALYIGGAIQRFASGGTGPRGVALAPDEQRIFVANYFSGAVSILSPADGKSLGTLSLGQQPPADPVRRGEMIFHDALHAFQRWHSCSTCHPNEGRVDGLRWDFLGDGIGNPKDTMSLVLLHKTEPLNRRATVATALDCARGGLAGTNMLVPTEQDVNDLYAYLTSLEPQPSPHRTPQGGLTPGAERGRALFEGKAACARCHPAPLFTDRKMHNVGVLSDNEPDGKYDTPSLLEGYRTAPYLHDGRALTLKEVLITHNDKEQHGKISALSPAEVDDLVEYLMSL